MSGSGWNAACPYQPAMEVGEDHETQTGPLGLFPRTGTFTSDPPLPSPAPEIYVSHPPSCASFSLMCELLPHVRASTVQGMNDGVNARDTARSNNFNQAHGQLLG